MSSDMGMDAFSDDFRRDPYPHYARIRDGAAAQIEEQPTGLRSWVVPSYRHARQVLLDARFSSSLAGADVENLRRGGVVGQDGEAALGQSMIMSDPPIHTRLRGLVRRAFTPRRVEALRPYVQTVADQLLDALGPKGSADLVADLAEPLPATVICGMLGVRPDDHADFRRWLRAMLTSVTTEDVREPREEGRGALYRYLAGLVASRQPKVDLDLPESQQPDLLSALIRAHDSEGRLNQRELVGMVLLIIIAGFETTRHLIGNGMLALFQQPDQLQLLRSRPDLLPSAIEELLRFDAPVPRVTYRVATEDLQIGDVAIPAGDLVTVLIGSANRDPRRFEDPDRLDITREDNQHLAFGIGPTTASALRWRDWRARSRSAHCSAASPTSTWSTVCSSAGPGPASSSAGWRPCRSRSRPSLLPRLRRRWSRICNVGRVGRSHR
jgi:cytochrome P450